MQAKITQKLVKTVQPGAADFSITDTSLPGFELRVRRSGAMSWVFRYRLNGGPQRRLRLGGFPGLSAEEARKLALAAAVDVAKGSTFICGKRLPRLMPSEGVPVRWPFSFRSTMNPGHEAISTPGSFRSSVSDPILSPGSTGLWMPSIPC